MSEQSANGSQAYREEGNRIAIGNAMTGPSRSPVFVDELVRDFPTPFFFYNVDHIAARAKFLSDAYRAEKLPVAIHYATKANANPAILRRMKAAGLKMDVVSAGEIETALSCGFTGADVLFSGVAKTVAEIEAAFRWKVGQINVESLGELERIARLAEKHDVLVSIGLRLNPNVCPETHPYITTGLQENKFGLDEVSVREALTMLKVVNKSKERIQFRGLSLHIGSQLLDLTAMDEALEVGVAVQNRIRTESGLKPDIFDVGGGIGIRYETMDESQEHQVVREHAALLKKHFAPELANGNVRQILVEPGRWLVARSGLLIAEVQYVKQTAYKKFLIVDGGMNLLIRPALYEAEHRIMALNATDSLKANSPTVDVVGPICESSDFLGRSRPLSHVHQGERLAVFDAGAYGRTMATNYNQRGWPAEYVYENGTVSRCDTL